MVLAIPSHDPRLSPPDSDLSSEPVSPSLVSTSLILVWWEGSSLEFGSVVDALLDPDVEVLFDLEVEVLLDPVVESLSDSDVE